MSLQDTRLTRRESLFALLATVTTAAAGSFFLEGCGSGSGTAPGSGGSGSTTVSGGATRSTGRVVLPPGFAFAPRSLKLISGFKPAMLRSDGSFLLNQMSSDSVLLTLTDASDRPLLFGFSGSAANGLVGEVSPAQTAVVLVFYALGAFTLPPDAQEQVKTLLAQDSEVQALGGQVASHLTANPLALAQSDPALFGPVTNLRDTLLAGAQQAARHQSIRTRQVNVAPTLIAVEPSGETAGFLAAPNAKGLGLTITNSRRRNAFLYIYEAEYTNQSGSTYRDAFVDHKIATGDIVWATSGLSGVVGSLIDYANGTVAYAPVSSSPYSLDLFPGDAVRAGYHIDIIANGNGGDPQGIQTPTYTAALAKISFITFVKDLFLPAVATIAGFQTSLKLVFDPFTTGTPETALLKAFDDLAVILSGVVDSGVAISAGSARSLLVAVLKAIGNNGTLRQKFIEWLTKAALAKGLDVGSTGVLASALNAVVILVDKLLGAGDLGAVLVDWTRSDSFVRFNATVTAPKVLITPATASLTPGDDLTLTARVTVDLNGASVFYRWTVAGGGGTLKNGTSGLTGKTVDSSAPTIQYLSDASAQEGDKASIQVEAFLGSVNDANPKSLGAAASPSVITFVAPKKGEPGTFKVDVKVDGDRAGATALVVFGPVPGATSYTLYGTGGDDPAYYHKTISITSAAPVQVMLADGSILDNAFGLASAAGPADRDYVGYYNSRFGGFTFTVTANK